MNNNVTPISARQNAKDAMGRLNSVEKRITDVEQTLQKVLMAVNQVLGQLGKSLDETAEVVGAHTSMLGAEEVAMTIAETRAANIRDQAEKTKAEIIKMISENKLLKSETVTGANSLIVGKEVLANGTEIAPGYAAVRFTQLKPDYQEKLNGKKVGDIVETEKGGNFTIQELYELAPVGDGSPVAAPEALPPAPAAEATLVDQASAVQA